MMVMYVIVFCAGAALVLATTLAAIRSFVLPRGDNVLLTRLVSGVVFRLMRIRLRFARTYAERDRVLALLPPIILLALPVMWMTCVVAGFTAMFWAVGVRPLYQAFVLSGSSLLTLGFAPAAGLAQTLLAFAAATYGLCLVALLIAYLPTIYNAFSRREAQVTLLDVRAGVPPSAVEMIARFHRLKRLERLNEQWPIWEQWFGEVEESHLSFSMLVFFRSQRQETSWVTAAGTILDSAALCITTVEMPHDAGTDLCIRAGYLALRNIAQYFGIPVRNNPPSDDPISVTRAEFDAACAELATHGVPLKPDLDAAWRAWAGWRVNYDDALLALIRLTEAPQAPWTGPRNAPMGLAALRILQRGQLPNQCSGRLPRTWKKHV